MAHATSAGPSADRNLLFGVLALQADLLDAARFAEACTAWSARKDTPLADVLVERGWLTPADRADVERLLDRKLKKHAGDARAGLAEVANDNVRQTLAAVVDPVVHQTLGSLPRGADVHENRTVSYQPAGRGRYTLTRLHAKGGLGQVWVARDSDLGREVAFKELLGDRADNPTVLARFLEEAKITGQLEHPNIVPVYELARPGGDGAGPFYTMRFIRGRTLAAAVKDYHRKRRANETGPLELRGLLGQFVAVCNAVSYAHSRGVLHRDLKPQNVVLGDYGEVIVLDWGLAKLKGAAEAAASLLPVSVGKEPSRDATVQGQALGTPAYMPPEQAEGRLDRVDERSDVYGLGATLYELLTGAPPFAGPDTATILVHVVADQPLPPRRVVPETPPALEAVCVKALEKQPAARYASAKALAQDVERWLADEPVTAWREPWPTRARRWTRRHRQLVTGAAALLLAAVPLSLLLAANREEARRRADRDTALISRSYAAEREAHQQAEANFQRTRAAVDEYFTTVSQSTLFDVPGLQPLRKELLESAVRYYRELAAERAEDPSMRAGLAVAHFRLAEVYFEVDQGNDSLREVDAGLDLVEQLLQEHPADADLFRRIGGFWKGTRRMSWTARPPDDQAGAERTLNRFVQVWERLAAKNPGLPAFQSDLATAYGCLGTLLGAYSRRGESIQSYRKSIALWERLARANPEEPEYKVSLVQAYAATAAELSRAGRVKSKEAEDYLNRALENWEEFAAKFPAAHRYRAALVNVLLLRGYYYQNFAQLEHAIADYSKAIELDPNNANTHFELGDACARLGRWDQAQAEMGKAVQLDPGNHWYMFHVTVLQIRAGDLAGYRRVCREMLKRFGDARQPEVAERTAKTCLLVPDAVADLAPVLRLADRAVTGTEKSSNYGFFVMAKGLAEYRAGRNAEAVNWVERLTRGAGNHDSDVAALAVLAMAQHQLGRREQACAALDKAEAIVAKKMADPGAGRPFGRDWDDWLRCRILLDEAGKLLKKDSRAKNQESGKKPD